MPRARAHLGLSSQFPSSGRCAGGLVAHVTFALALACGIYICGVARAGWGYTIHARIVWDELCGYAVTMLATPPTWYWLLAGFVLFRFFDIRKPWPIREADHSLHGAGIMLADVMGRFCGVILYACGSGSNARFHSGPVVATFRFIRPK